MELNEISKAVKNELKASLLARDKSFDFSCLEATESGNVFTVRPRKSGLSLDRYLAYKNSLDDALCHDLLNKDSRALGDYSKLDSILTGESEAIDLALAMSIKFYSISWCGLPWSLVMQHALIHKDLRHGVVKHDCL